MQTLLLWDIDGTLLSSAGSGMLALSASLLHGFGIDDSLDSIDWPGRTDRMIARLIFERFSIPHHEENLNRFLQGYLHALPAALVGNSRILPGIADRLTEAAARPDVAQALLTGNLRRGAEIKLGHHALAHHFSYGAFADDSEHRNELGPHALARHAAAHPDHPSPARIWVLGDTPHDIACGRVIGARTLAVATGHATSEDLASHHPDALLPDLSDGDRFWQTILG